MQKFIPTCHGSLYLWYTRRRLDVGAWLREISSCSCLTALPCPAWVLLSETNKPLFPPLYRANFHTVTQFYRSIPCNALYLQLGAKNVADVMIGKCFEGSLIWSWKGNDNFVGKWTQMPPLVLFIFVSAHRAFLSGKMAWQSECLLFLCNNMKVVHLFRELESNSCILKLFFSTVFLFSPSS